MAEDEFYGLTQDDVERLALWGNEPPPHAPDISGLVPYSALRVEHVEWTIPGLIPAGMLSVLAGEQGLGKSLLHAAWAAQLSQEDAASVLVSAEDSPTHTTKARLIAAKANEERVYHAAILPVLGNGKDPQWLARIREWIDGTEARLLVFDPLSAFLDANSDTYKDQHVRRILAGLDEIARDTGCSIVYIMHLTKGVGSNPLQRIMGSIAFTAAARSVVLLAPETTPQETGRILAHIKCNVAEKAQPQQWEIVPILIPALQGRDVRTARIEYRGTVDIDTYTLLLPREDADRGERDEAKEIIVSMLSSGECPSVDLERAVREAGVSSRTYDTARRELGIRAVKRGKTWHSQLVTNKDATGKDANASLRPSFPLNQADEFPF